MNGDAVLIVKNNTKMTVVKVENSYILFSFRVGDPDPVGSV